MQKIENFIIRLLVSLSGVTLGDLLMGDKLFSPRSFGIALVVGGVFYALDNSKK